MQTPEDAIVAIRAQIQDAMIKEIMLRSDEIDTVNEYIDLHTKVWGDKIWDKFETSDGLYYELLRAIEDLAKGKSVEEALPASHYKLVNGKYKHVVKAQNTSGGRRQRKNRKTRKQRR
jgi:hypothetical protein